MKHREKIAFIGFLVYILMFTGAVNAAVINEVIVCHDFDANGHPIPQYEFPVTLDVVTVWLNMTDLHENDTLSFEWWPPSGELYHTETWVAPPGIESMPYYELMVDIEIMGDPAENMPGEWSCNIYNNGSWWGHAVFELTSEGASPSMENIPSNVMAITDIQLPTNYTPGENVTISVTVAYNFDQTTDIGPSVWNNKTQTFIATVEDTVTGMGTKTYDLTFVADEPGTVYFMVAYFVNSVGDIDYTDEVGLVPFRLEDTNIDTGVEVPSIDDLDLPTDIDLNEIQDQISEYIDKLSNLNITIPDELGDVEEEVKRITGIPGYPIGSLVLGAAAALYLTRRKNKYPE